MAASAARPKPYGDGEHTSNSAKDQTYGGKEGITGQVRKVRAEALAIVEVDLLCELSRALRWCRPGVVHAAKSLGMGMTQNLGSLRPRDPLYSIEKRRQVARVG